MNDNNGLVLKDRTQLRMSGVTSSVELIKLTLCGPTDVAKEMALAAEAINDWNCQHGEQRGCRVSHHDHRYFLNLKFAVCMDPSMSVTVTQTCAPPASVTLSTPLNGASVSGTTGDLAFLRVIV